MSLWLSKAQSINVYPTMKNCACYHNSNSCIIMASHKATCACFFVIVQQQRRVTLNYICDCDSYSAPSSLQ